MSHWFMPLGNKMRDYLCFQGVVGFIETFLLVHFELQFKSLFFFFYCFVLLSLFVYRRVSLTPVGSRSPAVGSLFRASSSTEKAKRGQLLTWPMFHFLTISVL